MSEYDDLLPEDSEPVGAAAPPSAEESGSEEPVSLPPLMRASDLLPQVEPVEDDGAEVPPTPEESELQSLPLAEREQRKLQAMTPEQRMRYGMAQAEINAQPEIQAFAAEEERTRASKEQMSKAFIDAYKKKAKEKA